MKYEIGLNNGKVLISDERSAQTEIKAQIAVHESIRTTQDAVELILDRLRNMIHGGLTGKGSFSMEMNGNPVIIPVQSIAYIQLLQYQDFLDEIAELVEKDEQENE